MNAVVPVRVLPLLLLAVLVRGPAAAEAPAAAGGALVAADLIATTRRVVDWQLFSGRVWVMPTKEPRIWKSHEWGAAALWIGVLEWYQVSRDRRLLDLLMTVGRTSGWQPPQPSFHADFQAIGQLFLGLHALAPDPAMVAPMRALADRMTARREEPILDTARPGAKDWWSWADALFMSPPLFFQLTRITGERSYADYADRHWWLLVDQLWDTAERLLYRDLAAKARSAATGRKEFWARGNGWVFSALARILPLMAADAPQRPRYERLFRDLAERLVALQGADGLWTPSLLDRESFPQCETSASAFFCHGLAWGLNAGLLPAPSYRQAMERAWAGLVRQVGSDGRLAGVQPVGSAPVAFPPQTSDIYGVGAFLLAASEVVRCARTFDPTVHGARADGLTVCTAAIQQAIDAAAAAGGGTVRLPRGTYMTGALFLKSDVELRLDDGVMLRAVPDEAAYPLQPSRSAGIEMPWPAAIINAIGQRQVKLTGRGVLDGNGAFWWAKYWGADGKGGMRADYGRRGLRWAVDWDCPRPQAILFKDCEDVTVQDLTILRSPFWTLQLTYCTRVTVDGLTIRNNLGGHGPSSDGIDVDSSRDVLIQHCDIACNDDNICLKAGRDADGLRVGRPTENVIVRHCTTRAGHGMFTLGSETAGGIRHVRVHDLRAIGTRTGIRFKSARPRGGVVEDIRIQDIVMEGVAQPVWMGTGGTRNHAIPAEWAGREQPAHWAILNQPVEPPERGIPEFRDIAIAGVTASGAGQAFTVAGGADRAIRDVRFSRCRFAARTAGSIAHAADWRMDEVVVASADGAPLTLTDCRQVARPQVVTAVPTAEEPLRLTVVAEHAGPLIGPDHPGTADNRSGFETGCVVRQGGINHLFVNEMFGIAHRDLRIAHWTSADGLAWQRQGTLVSSLPGRAPSNPRSEVWVTGMAFDEFENRWSMWYVAYRGGDGARGEIAGSDYDGCVWRALSAVTGRGGLGGPYRDADIVLRPDAQSQPWEGQQGVDSFLPYQVGERWYAFYGSHNHLPRGPWQVGLAEAPALGGPWRRLATGNPVPLARSFVENPVVQELAPGRWLALFDADAPHAIGCSASCDGVQWSPGQMLTVQGEGRRWAGGSGLRDLRTPLGLLPQADGSWALLYTARMADRPFHAIGRCTVRVVTTPPAAVGTP